MLVQLYQNYVNLYSSLLCHYHETLEVTTLLPEDANLATTYDETTFATAFPVQKYGKVDKSAKGALQVRAGQNSGTTLLICCVGMRMHNRKTILRKNSDWAECENHCNISS